MVVAVVVTYEPCYEDFLVLLRALAPQVDKVILVDNASTSTLPFSWALGEEFPIVQMYACNGNTGIASAQNYGISLGINHGASHILLCDQDSVPAPNLVERLLSGLRECKAQADTLSVAAISPATIDSRTGRISTFKPIHGTLIGRHLSNQYLGMLPMREVGFLISSGMLIPVEVFAAVGGLRSEYFIDHVDTEWCFRARAAGYRLVGLELPLLNHSLGDDVQRVWLFRERHVSTHAPLRDYYMARNTLAMIKGGNLSLAWSAHFMWRIVQFFGFYVMLSNNKRQHLKMLFLGLLHGLRGINGKLNPATLQTEPIIRSPLDPEH